MGRLTLFLAFLLAFSPWHVGGRVDAQELRVRVSFSNPPSATMLVAGFEYALPFTVSLAEGEYPFRLVTREGKIYSGILRVQNVTPETSTYTFPMGINRETLAQADGGQVAIYRSFVRETLVADLVMGNRRTPEFGGLGRTVEVGFTRPLGGEIELPDQPGLWRKLPEVLTLKRGETYELRYRLPGNRRYIATVEVGRTNIYTSVVRVSADLSEEEWRQVEQGHILTRTVTFSGSRGHEVILTIKVRRSR